jgi:hypothetical protein
MNCSPCGTRWEGGRVYQFQIEHWRTGPLRTYVCPTCETGGASPDPVICWYCGQEAVDVGADHVAMSAPLITRITRLHERLRTCVDVQLP